MSSNVTTLIIDTGNLFNAGTIKLKALQDPNFEVLEGIRKVFCSKSHCLETIKYANPNKFVQCLKVDDDNPLRSYDRSKLKLSVKLFLYSDVCQDSNCREMIIEESIESICSILDIHQIDKLILSVQTKNIDHVVPLMKTFWKYCESFVSTEKICSIGTSDLNAAQLIDIYESASLVKPSSTQINLDACCNIPTDLSNYAKEKSIQLLTHDDPIDDFVPADKLNQLFMSNNDVLSKLSLNTNDSKNGIKKRKWIARYNCVIPDQGVVLSKGYLISLFI